MWILESTDSETPLLFRMMPGSLKTMGRAARADFIVDAALVSRLHCQFTLDAGDTLDVQDLGSTNGTWINGRKIVAKALLLEGDRVRVGRVEFQARQTPD